MKAQRPAIMQLLHKSGLHHCCRVQGLGSVRSIMKEHSPSVRVSCMLCPAAGCLVLEPGLPPPVHPGFGAVLAVHCMQGLDEVVIASIMRPVLSALQHLHAVNCIHRDVKVRPAACRTHARP